MLARYQFAFTISVHIIFPAISIGLASYLVVLEGLWLRTGKLVYRELFFFWSIQMIAGDAHGLNTLEHQPAKIAAIEGLWETEKGGTSLNLVGWPDMRQERTKYALSVPHLGSLILTHTWSGEIRGLKEFAPEDRPDSTIVFWSFRVMVGMGLLMLLLGVF